MVEWGKQKFTSFNPKLPKNRNKIAGKYTSQVRKIRKIWMRAEKKQMEWVGDVNYRILAIYDGNVLRWNIVYEIQIDATKKTIQVLRMVIMDQCQSMIIVLRRGKEDLLTPQIHNSKIDTIF